MPKVDIHQLLIKHLAKHSKGVPRCPICASAKWTVDSPMVSFLVEQGDNEKWKATNERGVLVPMVCDTCFFVYQFALAPILQEADDGE